MSASTRIKLLVKHSYIIHITRRAVKHIFYVELFSTILLFQYLVEDKSIHSNH